MTISVEKPGRQVFNAALRLERDYWVERLTHRPGASNLWLDFERASEVGVDRETVTIRGLDQLTERVAQATKYSPLLVYSVLVAALNVCLHKYTGGESIVIGSPARRREDGSPQPPNAVAIVINLDVQCTFKDLLFRTRETLLDAYARQDYPITMLLDDLGLGRPSNRCPLFDIAVVLQGFHTETPGLNHDITVRFSPPQDGLRGEIIFNPHLFQQATIERFAAHYRTLLQRALADVESRLVELEIIEEDERKQILRWNRTQAPYANNRGAHELFVKEAKRNPDAIAVHWADEHVTYRELNCRSGRLAAYLQKNGAGSETIVGVMMERSVESIIALFGVLKAGAVYLPMDPEYPRQRLTFMAKDAGVKLILTQSRLSAEIPWKGVPYLYLDEHWETISEEGEETGAFPSLAENAAYIIYTSGSTGEPKGVCASHEGVCNLTAAQNKAFGVGRSSRVFQFAPLGFDASISEIFTALTAGAVLDLGDPSALNAGPELSRQLDERGITIATLPPALLSTMPDADLVSLKTLVSAGEACTAELAARWSAGHCFINAYGPTEGTVCSTLHVCNEHSRRTPPIGRPIANTRVYILDEKMRLAPIGAAGELCIAGVGLARGYLNRPEFTGESFMPDPFHETPGSRLYRTGDRARLLPGGEIEYLGRIDRQIKLRGYRIEPAEIEAVLQSHPLLRDAIVYSPNEGEWKDRLLAYVIPTKKNDLEGAEMFLADDLRRRLAEKLPEYMIPSAFIIIDEAPLTPNGKIDWRALPPPEPQSLLFTQEYVAPRTSTEELTASIWADLLKLDRIGIYDNFFSLGGHSLLVVPAIKRLQETFEIDLPLRILFDNPTVADLAHVIEEIQRQGASPYQEAALNLGAEAVLDPSILPEKL